MGLESGSFIATLVSTNPVGATDPKSQGDDHIRLIKKALQNSFPKISTTVEATPAELNLVVGATQGLATLSASFTAIKQSLSVVTASLSALTTLVAALDGVSYSASVTSSDITGTIRTPILTATGVSAGTYTAATVVVDAKGRVIAATAGTTAGAWELVSTTTLTAVANVDFDLQEDIYCKWEFVGDGVIPATDDADLIFRMGYTGGTLFETTAYTASTAGRVTTPPTDNTIAGSSDAFQGVGTAAGEHANFVLTISGVNSAAACGFAWRFESSWKDTGNDPRSMVGSGYYSGPTARLWDAIRFLWSPGNFEAAGSIKMYGLKRAG